MGVRPSSRHPTSEANFMKIRSQFSGSSACVLKQPIELVTFFS